MPYTDTPVQNLIINKMTAKEYDSTTPVATEVYTITDSAGKNMDNITKQGYTVLDDTKALYTGDVHNDTSVYKDILKYNHSTFDSSKFSVIGTLSITNEGILSQTDNSNYLTASVTYNNVSTIRATAKFNTGALDKLEATPIYETTPFSLYMLYTQSGNYYPMMRVSDGTNSFALRTSTVALSQNTDYYAEFSYNVTTKELVVKVYDAEFALIDSISGTATNDIAINNGTYTATLGRSNNVSTNFSQDLKFLTIETNDIVIFNGNDSRIDILKPDNYSIVGTPTITEDGIAGGFSGTSGIDTGFKLIPSESSWEVKLRTFFKPLTLSYGYLVYNIGDRGVIITQRAKDIRATVVVESGDNVMLTATSSSNYIAGDVIDLSLKYDSANKTYSLVTYRNETKDAEATIVSESIVRQSDTNTMLLGYRLSTTQILNNLIDLNSFRVYINGHLVYQPCLKIPYNQSNTHSRIVNAYARNRVQDVYEQGYLEKYYTINEVNENYTLPIGDIYGMIEASVESKQDYVKSLPAIQNKGEVIYNEKDVAEELIQDAHSTFDLSKFNIVGTPIITNDGIASDFSGSNRIKTTFDYNGNTLEICNGFYFKTDSDGGNIFEARNNSNVGIVRNYIGTTNNIILFGVSGENLSISSTDYNPSENDFIITKALINNDKTITFTVINKTKNIIISKTSTGTITNEPSAIDNTLYIGNANGNEWYSGLIDLKYTSIRIDNIEIFNGNKTGLDILKPDNYTVNGSLTITNDGIASGFTNNDTVDTISIDTTQKNYRVELKNFKYLGGQTFVFGTKNVNNQQSFDLIIYNNNIWLFASSSGTGWDIAHNTIGTNRINNNDIVDIAFIRENGTTYKVELYNRTTGVKATDISISSSTDLFNTTDKIELGGSGWTAYTGYIDLSTFTVYVDGNLIYQPCLKIPYTDSKDGKKIVDFIYKNRVQDAYEQFGSAPYVVLDEFNENYILPMGSIYGIINTAVKKDTNYITSLPAIQNKGKVIYDEKDVVGKLIEDAHSTYDSSKFTIVGTPTITNDGILSNTTNSAYVSIPIATVSDMTSGGSWRIDFAGKFPSNSSDGFKNVYCNTNGIRIGNINGNGNFFLQVFDSTSTSHAVYLNNYVSGTNLNKDYIGYASFDGVETYTVAVSVDNGATWATNTMTTSEKVYFSTATLRLCEGGDSVSSATFDLKKYAIWINGIPVFNGNKTGIDTIKPDDYTVVGTPTISADGIFTNTSGAVASVYSANSYNMSGAKHIEFLTPYFKVNSLPASNIIVTTYGDNSTGCFVLGIYSNGKIQLNYNNTSGTGINTNVDYSAGKWYQVKYEIIDTTCNLYYRERGNAWSLLKTATVTAPTSNTTVRIAEVNQADGNYSGDLNGCKLYVDGNLVYQPCLKIPYTDSKDGKKIVDSIYKNRVESMYEQFGYAPYVTLNEVDKTYTLPMGSIYGLIGTRTLRDSYRNGIDYWELYSDRTLEQGGSCTSGTAVTFVKPFADTNYVLTVPYSAKTTTGFTPSQTGDWIAKGTGNL